MTELGPLFSVQHERKVRASDVSAELLGSTVMDPSLAEVGARLRRALCSPRSVSRKQTQVLDGPKVAGGSPRVQLFAGDSLAGRGL